MDPRTLAPDFSTSGWDLWMPCSGGPPGYVLPQHSRRAEHILSYRGDAGGGR